MNELRYPLGIETFSEIIKEGYVYVDKTEYIHKLLSRGKYYFLSRPRRFGKSLLLSTLESFFEGRRDLFEGLAISRHEYDWESYPVLRLNFVNAVTTSVEGIRSIIEDHLKRWERIYGISDEYGLEQAQRFYGIIERAAAKTGRKVVILVDEYDKALVSSIDDERLNESFCEILKPIFATLKAADRHIRFAMLTGVTRFSRLSIFSDINHLKDITLNDEFAAICGITEQEFLETLRPGIESFAIHNEVSAEEAFASLKENYDGYHFSATSPDIYNPYSLLNALDDRKTADYWFATGTPTFLMEKLRERAGEVVEFFNHPANADTLSHASSSANDLTALLFQTGYLTIKGVDAASGTYILGIPNMEVKRGIYSEMLPVFAGMTPDDSSVFITKLTYCANHGEPQRMLELLKSFLAGIPYDLSKNKPEVYFENNIYIIFRLLGFNVHTEYRTSRGRIDMVLLTKDNIYVMELKLTDTAKAAMEQINSKEYMLPFSRDERRLFKIGIGFSKRTRNISRWIIEEQG